MTILARRKRILLVDDHPLVREGLCIRIGTQPDLEVCGDAADSDEALRLVKERSPDLVIVDITLKSSNGIELVKQITQVAPQVKTLVVSAYQESLYGERAMRAGAQGYLNKQESSTKLLDAIRAVLDGERYVSPELASRFISQAISTRPSTCSPIDRLSNREMEIFRRIGQGQPTGVIAEELHLSRHTIDTHRENIKRKLGAKDAGELMRLAVQFSLENG